MMSWENLLSGKRIKLPEALTLSKNKLSRSDFEMDYDRIIFSPAFRSLQDKTQLIPFPKTDFVHTRLTHSLEVSCVGRGIGKYVGHQIKEKIKNKNYNETDIGNIVAAACLAHDIGNPPFGHAGEKAISKFFLNYKTGNLRNVLQTDEKQYTDLTNFEGNANGFRILTNTGGALDGGLRLTYTTLAAFTKYPKESYPVGDLSKIYEKKYGFFQSEKELFNLIASDLGLKKTNNDNYCWKRHPLAYLVEAADDICYNIIDLEDGIRLNLIPFRTDIEELLKNISGTEFNRNEYNIISNKQDKICYLRTKAIKTLINEVGDIFVEKEEKILKGELDKSLIEQIDNYEIFKDLKNIVEELFVNPEVLEIEIAGFEIIPQLLDIFIEATVNESTNESRNKGSEYERKILQLLHCKDGIKKGFITESIYEKMLNICDFIASMTDTYAIMLYRKLKGISLPAKFR